MALRWNTNADELTEVERLRHVLCALYWSGGLSEEQEMLIASVVTAEQRVAWAREYGAVQPASLRV